MEIGRGNRVHHVCRKRYLVGGAATRNTTASAPAEIPHLYGAGGIRTHFSASTKLRTKVPGTVTSGVPVRDSPAPVTQTTAAIDVRPTATAILEGARSLGAWIEKVTGTSTENRRPCKSRQPSASSLSRSTSRITVRFRFAVPSTGASPGLFLQGKITSTSQRAHSEGADCAIQEPDIPPHRPTPRAQATA